MGILEDAKPEKCFYCSDGTTLHNLKELGQKLKTISSETYRHHVNQARNDFHNWVRDVFQEHDLANRLLRAKTAPAAAAMVESYIKRAIAAQEEIETAIRKIIERKNRRRTSATAKKAKARAKKSHSSSRNRQKTAAAKKAAKKNRKVNKKKQRVKKQRKSSFSNRHSSRGSSGKRGKSRVAIRKNIQKQMRQWLKWLKLSPEL